MTATSLPPALSAKRPALVVAHPGHELRVFGWLDAAQPTVYVLTDGSGSGGEARIESTTAILERTSASRGSIYGRMTDREIYAAMLARDFALFIELAEELAEAFVASEIDYVVGDSIEGYNPSHDACRLVINAAVDLAARRRQVPIPTYDFPLVEAPDACPEQLRPAALRVELDEATLSRKLEAARGYRELRVDVEEALERFGPSPFRTECLRPVNGIDPYGWDPKRVPYYEVYGEKRVAAGAYDTVVRFRDHLMPLADALWSRRDGRA